MSEHLQDLDVETYRQLAEGVPAILYIDEADDASTNRYTSPQIEAVLGFTVQDWSDPELWIHQLHPDDRERALEEHRRSNETGDRYLSEYRLLTQDGRIVWIRDEAVLVRTDDGTPQYWRGVMLDITKRKEAEDKLRWSLDALRRTIQQRRELLQRLENAQEEERRRIAADIHDDPIQVMSAVDMRLQLLNELGDGTANSETLSELHEDVKGAISRLRSLLFELRPHSLEREGLGASLATYLKHTSDEWDVQTELDDRSGVELPPDLRAIVFRIAQEAIVNARKHGSPTKIRVELSPASGGTLMRVIDDGKGFDPSRARPEPGHLGMATMSERAEIVGGWCRVASAPGKGTTVECWLPQDLGERSASA